MDSWYQLLYHNNNLNQPQHRHRLASLSRHKLRPKHRGVSLSRHKLRLKHRVASLSPHKLRPKHRVAPSPLSHRAAPSPLPSKILIGKDDFIFLIN